jgi:hypothetical protein
LTEETGVEFDTPQFELRVWEEILDVSFPLWCALLLFITFAAFPWIGKLTWRFTLRTLLIATTLVAVVHT